MKIDTVKRTRRELYLGQCELAAHIPVAVHMSLEQAEWLKGILQNPIYCDDPSDEDAEFHNMRKKLFNIFNETIQDL